MGSLNSIPSMRVRRRRFMSDNMETTGLSGPVQNKGKPVSARRVLTILVFIAPTLLFYGFIMCLPLPKQSISASWTGMASCPRDGRVANWIRLVHDPNVWYALKNNLILMVTSICIQLPGALILALLINSRLKGVRIFKALWFCQSFFPLRYRYIMEPDIRP